MNRDQLPTIEHLEQMQAILLDRIDRLTAEVQAIKQARNLPEYVTPAQGLELSPWTSKGAFNRHVRAAGVRKNEKGFYKTSDLLRVWG